MEHVVSVSKIGLSTVAGYLTFGTIHNQSMNPNIQDSLQLSRNTTKTKGFPAFDQSSQQTHNLENQSE